MLNRAGLIFFVEKLLCISPDMVIFVLPSVALEYHFSEGRAKWPYFSVEP